MKAPFLPLALSALVLAAGWQLVDRQFQGSARAKKGADTISTEIRRLESDGSRLADEQRMLEQRSFAYAAFLDAWGKAYIEDHTIDAISNSFPEIGDRFGVLVVENKRETYKGKPGDAMSGGTLFKVRATGSASNLLRFLGEIENRYELLGFKDVALARGLTDLTLEVTFTLPDFKF